MSSHWWTVRWPNLSGMSILTMIDCHDNKNLVEFADAAIVTGRLIGSKVRMARGKTIERD